MVRIWLGYLELEADILGQGTINKDGYCFGLFDSFGREIQ